MIPADRVHMAGRGMPNPGKYRLTPIQTQQLLGTAAPGEYLFQATLVPPRDLLAPYGLDPGLCRFKECIPDLLAMQDGGHRPRRGRQGERAPPREPPGPGGALRPRPGPRPPRTRAAAPRRRRARRGLAPRPGASPSGSTSRRECGCSATSSPRTCPPMLAADPLDVGWHLHSRCEWCPFYHYCRDEAEATSSVSLLPYLSVHARRYLHEAPWDGGTPVETLDDLGRLLERSDATTIFSLAGSLRNQEAAYGRALAALRTGAAVSHDAVSIAFPRSEDLRLVLTLQEDPVTGRIYAAGLNRYGGSRVFGSPSETRVFVAERRDDCPDVVAAFLRDLYDLLLAVHGHNGGREWARPGLAPGLRLRPVRARPAQPPPPRGRRRPRARADGPRPPLPLPGPGARRARTATPRARSSSP